MDWNKSKNIILVILLITNVFLIFVYKYHDTDADEESSENVYQYTMNVLEENNIFYEGEIYSDTLRMHTLTVSYGEYDSELVSETIESMPGLPEGSQNETGYKAAADELLEICGFMDDSVVYEGVSTEGTSVVVSYQNYYEDTPVEDCYMRVYFDGARMSDFERKWMQVVSESESRASVISQLSALLKFMSETDSSERITVTDMHIVYWIDDYDVGDDVLYDTALPAWCLKYNDGQVKYISATVQ